MTGTARSVTNVFQAQPFHWVGNGFFVSSYFPHAGLPAQRVSPFLLMDYGPPKDFPALSSGRRGVGWHPHRGFETVTVAWEGTVAHSDSLGHSGTIGPGDVQWMTAAGGILHQEFHEPEFTRKGGRMHMMQLWVNLPKAHKMDPAGYQALEAKDIPVVSLPDDAGQVRVIAGEFGGVKGAAKTFTPLSLLDTNLRAGACFSVTLPPTYNAMCVVTRGRVVVGDRKGEQGELMLLENNGTRLDLLAESDCHLLILAGEPIDEPIVQHGPFVMNTVEEIHQAIEDFNAGKLGRVPR
jgi:redox-sensitive bicupin YhaK (pirin superfamily)